MSRANSWKSRKAAASERGRKMARARWSRPQEREVDADTTRWRALRDAKGKVLREGVTYAVNVEPKAWQVTRSAKGRTNQLDIVVNGQVFKTLGRRRLKRLLPGVCHG